jgi:hypothetical protein
MQPASLPGGGPRRRRRPAASTGAKEAKRCPCRRRLRAQCAHPNQRRGSSAPSARAVHASGAAPAPALRRFFHSDVAGSPGGGPKFKTVFNVAWVYSCGHCCCLQLSHLQVLWKKSKGGIVTSSFDSFPIFLTPTGFAQRQRENPHQNYEDISSDSTGQHDSQKNSTNDSDSDDDQWELSGHSDEDQNQFDSQVELSSSHFDDGQNQDLPVDRSIEELNELENVASESQIRQIQREQREREFKNRPLKNWRDSSRR